MLALTLLNIVLRLFDSTLIWAEPLVRHLVFFSAFLGAALASGHNEHIKIDIVSKLLTNKLYMKIYEIIISLFTLIVLFYLFKSGHNFYAIEKDYPTDVFLFFKNYHLIALIPIGFFFIGLQSFLHLLESLVSLLDFGKTTPKAES